MGIFPYRSTDVPIVPLTMYTVLFRYSFETAVAVCDVHTWDNGDVILSTVVNVAMLEVYHVSSVISYEFTYGCKPVEMHGLRITFA